MGYLKSRNAGNNKNVTSFNELYCDVVNIILYGNIDIGLRLSSLSRNIKGPRYFLNKTQINDENNYLFVI